jgi:hypothetical protein
MVGKGLLWSSSVRKVRDNKKGPLMAIASAGLTRITRIPDQWHKLLA